MHHKILYFFLLGMLGIQACKKEPTEPDPSPWMPPPLEPYEEVGVSFSLPDLGLDVEKWNSVCVSPNVYQELSYGGSSGFFYTNGITYYYSQGEYPIDISLRFYVRGFEEITSSRILIESIYELCSLNPEQCFANLILETDGKKYTTVDYTEIPFWTELKDSNALYAYKFLEDDYVLECFENRPALPVEFQFDGYIYTHERDDSILVKNLHSEFLVLMSY